MIWTVVTVGLINALAAYLLAHLVAPGRAPSVSTIVILIVALGAIMSLIVAVRGWRDHFRRRRMIS